MRIAIQSAVHIATVIISTWVIAAEISPNVAELPTGDVWPSASPRHPLAKHRKPIPAPQLSEHIQLVLTDRSDLSRGKEFGVFSSRTWRLADLGAKHAFLRAALGWGSMPASLVEQDIARGELVEIKLQDVPIHSYIMAMSAAYRMDAPPGLAGRWLVERLKENNSVRNNAGRAPPKDRRQIMRQLAKKHRCRAK
jgi:DNA-binding transcriptional LysR family regulator